MKPELRYPEILDKLKEQVAYDGRFKHVMNQSHAAKDIDQIFLESSPEILELFDAEHLTLYAVDYDAKEIYSKFLDPETLREIQEIRLPISELSIAGFAAKTRLTVNIADAYNKDELARISPGLFFDSSWDKKTGIKTRQMLTVPVLSSTKFVTGVLQLINKKYGARFTSEDEEKAKEIAGALGIALYNQYRLATRKATKFDYLVSSGLISQAELEAAVREARDAQKDTESVLMATYKIPKKDIGKSLEAFYKCPFIEFEERVFIPRELVKNINLNYLKANYWIPLRHHEDTIEVLIDDPHSFQKIRDIRRLFPLENIQFYVGLREDIAKFFNAMAADLDPYAPRESIRAILGELSTEEREKIEEASAPVIDENDSAIVRLANQIIIDAYRARASDIHIEPRSDKKETLIRFRVDGNCYEYLKIPPNYRRALPSRLKIMARLDIAERRKPQDGKIKFSMPDREIELRVATIPTQGIDNEDVVMRILTTSEPIPLEKLNMSERNYREFKLLLEKPYGIILCVGPTGSGKTTTLHAALSYLNDPETKIWTAEDPVEITQDGLRQVQVQPRIGFNFATAMRAFLRSDPDVIMVGEMRDRETCEIAIEASLTGHLVLSTLHTNSAVETVTRLLEMGMDPFNFSDALLGVLGQRLVRTLCQSCKEGYHPSKEEQQALARVYGEKAFSDLVFHDNFLLYRGNGCEACKQTGYRGRTAIHELLVVTDEIKKLIQSRAAVAEMHRVAVEQGMSTLAQDGLMKCVQAWTDFKQVKAVAMI